MMFKRNDGYALSYVLVVLMVLAIIATAVMAPPLRNLQMQQASIERMQDKYIAQGMIEQVVAQIEHATTELDVTSLSKEENGYRVAKSDTEDNRYIITASYDSCTVIAKINLTVETATVDNITQYNYTVSYDSYEISYHTGGGE